MPRSFRVRQGNAVGSLVIGLMIVAACGGCRRESTSAHEAPGAGRAGSAVASGDKSDSILIGVLAPFNTPPGEGIRHGVQLAVQEINAGGGVLGRRFDTVEVNTEFSATKGLQGYQWLAGRKHVAAVIGTAGDCIFPIMQQLARYKTPVLGTGVGSDRLTDMVGQEYDRYRWFFRVMHKSSELGNVTADFARNCLAKQFGITRFAVMVEDDIWTKYIRDIWMRELNRPPATQVVFQTTFGSGTQDFRIIFHKIIQSQAQYILDACSRVEASTYLKQWAVLPDAPPIGAIPTGAGTKRYYDLLGRNGLYVCSVATIPSPENPLTPKSAAWWNRYTARYGDPSYTSGYSYDAVWILAEALKRAGTASPEQLVAALEKTDTHGVVAHWRFAADHHPLYGPGYREIPIIQYVAPNPRGYRVIWPEHRANAQFTPPPRRR